MVNGDREAHNLPVTTNKGNMEMSDKKIIPIASPEKLARLKEQCEFIRRLTVFEKA